MCKDLGAKNTKPEIIIEDSLLCGSIDLIPKCFFDSIDEQTVMNAALNTKGLAGPSGMDADLYRRILC